MAVTLICDSSQIIVPSVYHEFLTYASVGVSLHMGGVTGGSKRIRLAIDIEG